MPQPREKGMITRRSRAPRIGLLGMFTSHNLGDTAIVQEMRREIRARLPKCEFVGICREPAGAVRIHGMAAFHSSGYGAALHADGSPWLEVEHPGPRWLAPGLGTRRIVAVARRLDLLVMTGGGQVDDFFGGPNSQPRALFTWSLIARALGVPTAFFSVGVDQLLRRSSRMLVVNAIRLAKLRSFREAGSVDLLRKDGLGADCRVVPDPAFGLAARRVDSRSWQSTALVVVSPISFRTWTETREAYYDSYLEYLASVCETWLKEGRRLRFVCSDIEMDPPVVRQIMSRLTVVAGARAEFAEVKTVEAFLESIAGARFVVASRLHGLILSLAAGTPVIAISPARKVTRLMVDFELDDFCIEMPAMSVEALRTAAARVEGSQGKLRDRIAASTQRCLSDLAQAYDELVSLLP